MKKRARCFASKNFIKTMEKAFNLLETKYFLQKSENENMCRRKKVL